MRWFCSSPSFCLSSVQNYTQVRDLTDQILVQLSSTRCISALLRVVRLDSVRLGQPGQLSQARSTQRVKITTTCVVRAVQKQRKLCPFFEKTRKIKRVFI
ncbi:hypothetical protein Hanom_Chr08g00720271 [Helianthus anomalus]